MRAVVFREHSPSLDVYEMVEDMPTPVISSDEVLVRVQFAALNRLDNWVRVGWRGLNLDFPHIPCGDFSGTIAQVGEAVEGWQEGQRVTANPLLWCGKCRNCLRGYQNRCVHWHILGETVRGACAEYVKIPARNLIAIPAGYDMQKAAAASLVYVTAWHNLMVAGNLRAGERVLIVGAGGGVNTASLQIAKLAGAEVMMIASTAEKPLWHVNRGPIGCMTAALTRIGQKLSIKRLTVKVSIWWWTMSVKQRGQAVCVRWLLVVD